MNGDDELRAMRQLPPGDVAGVLGLQLDSAAKRQHGGEGFSYWRTPEGALITVKDAGRGGFPVWHLTKRGDGAGAGGDWIALAQFIQPGATIGHVRKMLRPALGVGRTASLRASAPLLAPQAATTTVEPPKPLLLCEPPAWAVDYLHHERGIPIPTLKWAAAMHAILGHKPGYAPDPEAVHLAFPHTLRDGAAAWAELRGAREADGARSRKASRGTKGLWILPPEVESRAMVATESAIKGLALHARLAQASKHAWVVSTGGSPGQDQLDQLNWLACELGIETVALAQDRDAEGDQQASKCAAVLPAPIKTPRLAPPSGFVGWDDWAAAQRG